MVIRGRLAAALSVPSNWALGKNSHVRRLQAELEMFWVLSLSKYMFFSSPDLSYQCSLGSSVLCWIHVRLFITFSLFV